MDAKMFDEFYDSMTEGDMQHMANRLYAYHGIYPQKLKALVEAPRTASVSSVVTVQELVQALESVGIEKVIL